METTDDAATVIRPANAHSAAPYWALLPSWLTAASPNGARRRRALGPSALRDCARGQAALFHALRLHDDLFDGDDPDPALVWRGDRAMIDAERLFARHLGRHERFWTFKRSAVDATVRGIEEVAALERRPGAFGHAALRLHARVGSIFKVGAAAVLALQGRPEVMRRVHSFADSLAIAGQLLDDLEDLRADLARGRYTFVANLLLAGSERPRGPARAGRTDRLLAAALVRGKFGTVFREVRRHLDRARRSARRLGLPQAEEHVAFWLRAVDAREARLHRLRVDALLAPLIGRR